MNPNLFLLVLCVFSFFATYDARTVDGFSAKIISKYQRVKINGVATTTWAEDEQYMMEFHVGTPPVRTYGVIDTTGSLVLLQCIPCQQCALFNPLLSQTYLPLPCDADSCNQVSHHYCKNDECQYEIIEDDIYTVVPLATDTLYFKDDDFKVENRSLLNATIGCNDNHNSTGLKQQTSVIGLNRSPTSLIQQFFSNRQFLYCFGDWDSRDAAGYIKFGVGASLHGDETPILSMEGDQNKNYHINLESITVNGNRVTTPDMFSGGLIIDTTTRYSRINATAFDLLSAELDTLLGMDHFSYHTLEVCYENEASKFVFGPSITFHLRGVDLNFATWSTWVSPIIDIFCLAMHPTYETSVLGNFQQQNVEFGYDLGKDLIYINQMISCGNRSR